MKLHSRKNILTALVFGCFFSLSAQIDTTVWNSTRKIEDNRFIAEIPSSWKNVALPPAAEYSHKFELSGIGIKPIVLETPLVAFLSIKKSTQLEINAIIDEELKDFNNFSDKVQEANYKFDTTSIKSKTGEIGLFYHTRFYRRSKASNYSRYYYFVKHPKTNEYYILSFTYQYKDPTYDIERSNKFKEYALKTISRFSLR